MLNFKRGFLLICVGVTNNHLFYGPMNCLLKPRHLPYYYRCNSARRNFFISRLASEMWLWPTLRSSHLPLTKSLAPSRDSAWLLSFSLPLFLCPCLRRLTLCSNNNQKCCSVLPLGAPRGFLITLVHGGTGSTSSRQERCARRFYISYSVFKSFS